ncbi:MAG TPA: hypothetical protein VMM78_18275 [Thermomicrobiales bacterium]|nr:hypothetical protein [Thermomicrobiales bacterium]
MPSNDRSDIVAAGSELAAKTARMAAHTLDDQRDVVAGQLNRVAKTLKKHAGDIPGGEPTSRLSRTAAGQLSDASKYVRTHKVERMGSDLERFIRARPVMAIAVALFVGLALGRVLRR